MSVRVPVNGLPEAGSLVGGCELIRAIGQGGVGVVWLAREVASAEFRAVKVVVLSGSVDDASFARELKGWQRLKVVAQAHPGMVQVFDSGVAAGGHWMWATMELADSGDSERGMRNAEVSPVAPNLTASDTFDPDSYRPRTLASEIEARGRLPVMEVLELTRPVLEALGALHPALVHRDVKPANLLYVGGKLKLADPGLLTEARATQTVVGTREFTPFRGASEPSGDLYSLGKVLYAAALGRLPSDVAQLPTLGLPPKEMAAFLELQEILFQACAEDPARRYSSAEAMRQDVQRLLAGESLRQVNRFKRRARRSAVTTGLALALSAVVSWGWRHEVTRNREVARLASENKDRLIQLFKANADHAEGEGAFGLAALWLAEALRPASDTNQIWRLRYRIGALRQRVPPLVATGAHDDSISEAEFSPDGRSFLTVSEDGTAALWETMTGVELGMRWQHPSAVNTGQFSPDGRQVVTGCADGTVTVWDVNSGRQVHQFTHGGEVLMVGFHPEGDRVVSAGRDSRATVWNVSPHPVSGYSPSAEGRERALAYAIQHEKPIDVATFSPDGRWLLTSSKDGTARLWNAKDGSPAGKVFRHQGEARYSTFSGDGRRLATAGSDGVAQVWDVESGEPAGPPIHHVPLYYVEFSPDGKRLVTAGGLRGSSGEARVWAIDTGAAASPTLLHGGRVRHAAFSPDGRWVATASQDGSVRLHDLQVNSDVSIKLPMGKFVWSVAFSPDGKRLLTAGEERIWRIWDLEAYRAAVTEFPASADDMGMSAALTGEGSRVVVQFVERKCGVFDPTTGQEVSSFSGSADTANRFAMNDDGFCVTATRGGRKLVGWDASRWSPSGRNWSVESPIERVFLSPDSRSVVTFHNFRGAWFSLLFGLEASPPEPFTLAHRFQAAYASFSPDSRWLAVIARVSAMPEESDLQLWSVETGEPVWPTKTLPRSADSISFSPDSHLLAASFSAPAANTPVLYHVYNVNSGEPTGGAMPHPDGVIQVAFAPDRLVLATGCVDGGVRLWRVPEGEQIGPVMRHQQGITGVAWSSEGRVLISGSDDRTVRLWDSETGQPLGPPWYDGNLVYSLRLADRGRFLLFVVHGGGARLWRLPQPVEGSVEEVGQLLQRETGLKLSGGHVVVAGAMPETPRPR